VLGVVDGSGLFGCLNWEGGMGGRMRGGGKERGGRFGGRGGFAEVSWGGVVVGIVLMILSRLGVGRGWCGV